MLLNAVSVVAVAVVVVDFTIILFIFFCGHLIENERSLITNENENERSLITVGKI